MADQRRNNTFGIMERDRERRRQHLEQALARHADVRGHDGDRAGGGIGWNDGGDAQVKIGGGGIGETGARAVEENAGRAREVGALANLRVARTTTFTLRASRSCGHGDQSLPEFPDNP